MADFLSLLQSLDDTPIIRENYVRAPFPYPGSKARSLDKILPHLPYKSRYCEPFGGTGSVLLSRRESRIEIFNDRYSGVTCFFRVIRDKEKCNALVERLSICIHSREEFIWSRDTWKNCEDEVERAARWFYTICKSFGAQGRNFGRGTKSTAQFTNTFWGRIENIFPCHQRLKNVQIENQDWRQCLKDFDSPDMVWYIDPPYYQYAQGMYECELKKEDHEELLERIQSLKGFVALSGYENRLYDSYKWDSIHSWELQNQGVGLAYTDTNNLEEFEGTIGRTKSKETLYIKENS